METALQRNHDLERFVLVSLKKSNSKQLFADLERSEYDSVMKEFCDQLQKSHFSVQFNWI